MYIRQATLTDLDLLSQLGRRTFFDAFADDNDPGDMAEYLAKAFAPETIRAQLSAPEGICFLIFAGSSPADPAVGYAYLLGHTSEEGVVGAHPIQLVRLYVEQFAIGKGYGSQLMQTCLNYAAQRGFDTIWLGVWEYNFRALKFYDRWGFREVGTQPFVLGSDIQTDKVLMRAVQSMPRSRQHLH